MSLTRSCRCENPFIGLVGLVVPVVVVVAVEPSVTAVMSRVWHRGDERSHARRRLDRLRGMSTSRAHELLPIPSCDEPVETYPGMELTDEHRQPRRIEERFVPGPR